MSVVYVASLHQLPHHLLGALMAAGCAVRQCEGVVSRLLSTMVAGVQRSHEVVLFEAVGAGLSPDAEVIAAVKDCSAYRQRPRLVGVIDPRFAGTAARADVTAALLAAGADDVIAAWMSSGEVIARIERVRGRPVEESGSGSRVDGVAIECLEVPTSGSADAVAVVSASPTRSELVGRPSPHQLLARNGHAIRPQEHITVKTVDASTASATPSGSLANRPWIDARRRELVGARGRLPLTVKEATVMGLLINTSGVVLRQQLGDAVWTQGWSGTPKAIDMHVANLRKKLRVVSAGEWSIVTVRGTGFLLEESPSRKIDIHEAGTPHPAALSPGGKLTAV